ncbi:hypothetical protein H5410_027383 [Solanum commersonii]|uniref:SWIM-type domain-containing protein n=1 Tax=Solanum commersonii TaxID=4109 RepID=A0A9J5YYZ0_SOLCO|nr:hypothetical protein H5410_027383 [Solanum commersonii]
MLDICIDGSSPTLRIHVNARPPIEPTNSFDDENDTIGNERLGNHSKESLGDHSNESLGDHSMNIHDDPTNVENQSVDAKDPERECFEKWSRAHFPDNKYDAMTTNIAESLNAMLIEEKEYPVASIFNLIANRFGELFRERHAYILKSMGNQMVSSAKKIARKKMIEGDSLYVENVTKDGNQFTMFGEGVTAYVDLLKKSCSCREYDLIKIPCAHAMTALRLKHGNEYGMSIYEYCSPLYKVKSYLLAYLNSINVVPLESEWCVLEELLNVNILPPLVDTKLGRKRREHVKGVGENFKSKRRKNVQFAREPDTREPHV